MPAQGFPVSYVKCERFEEQISSLNKHRTTELRITKSVKDKTRGSSQDPWVYDSAIEVI